MAQLSEAQVQELHAKPPKTLPRRDYFLMPLLSVMTVALLCGAAEIACRLVWPQQDNNSCRVDDASGTRYLPNCVSRMKFAEGPWFENKYNECGYRTTDSCGPKPPGVFRIVVLGSSIVSGWGVPYEQTLVPLVSQSLFQACGQRIEIQNISTSPNLLYIYRRSNEALALNPDLVVLILGPSDTEGWYSQADLAARDNLVLKQSAEPTFTGISLGRLLLIANRSRSVLMARHFLHQDAGFTLRAIPLHPLDSETMLAPPTPHWKSRLADLDLLVGGMADKLHAHRVPLVVVPAIGQAQAILLNTHSKLPGFDPRQFEENLSTIALAHQATAVDIYDDFAQVPFTRLFYAADSHLSSEGYAVLTHSLVRQLLASRIISGCKSPNMSGRRN